MAGAASQGLLLVLWRSGEQQQAFFLPYLGIGEKRRNTFRTQSITNPTNPESQAAHPLVPGKVLLKL